MMMSTRPIDQLTTGLLVAATPWIVARVALLAASRFAHWNGQPLARSRAFVFLQRATVLAFLVVSGFALWLPPRAGWMAVVEGVVFVILAAAALRALHDVDSATRAARQVDSPTRMASLVARRSSQYLPSYWRALLFGVAITGVALFAWRASLPSPVERHFFEPVLFALIAPVFLWLYETWIHDLVTGPAVADPDDADHVRRRSIRMVFAVEFVLVAGFLALAHALLDLDRSQPGAVATIARTAGVLLGVLGCSLAVASDLITRRYAPPAIERRV